MAIIRATVKLKPVSGITADEVNNVWHFNATDGFAEATEANALTAAFLGFYGGIQSYLGPTILRGPGHEVVYATVNPGSPGPGDDTVSTPIITQTFSLGAFTVPTLGNQLPTEVAACLSMRGDYSNLNEEAGNTRPRSRVRGRIYIGPLTSATLSREPETYRPFVFPTFRGLVLDEYIENFSPTALTALGLTHVIYSPSNGSFAPVEEIWMDDAFDIIRSRGEAPSSRITQFVQN